MSEEIIRTEESEYPKSRNASAQAWRRLHKTLGPGEAKGLAADIAEIVRVEGSVEEYGDLAASIEFALEGFNWEGKKQL
jgi:hypothetical protein